MTPCEGERGFLGENGTWQREPWLLWRDVQGRVDDECGVTLSETGGARTSLFAAGSGGIPLCKSLAALYPIGSRLWMETVVLLELSGQ